MKTAIAVSLKVILRMIIQVTFYSKEGAWHEEIAVYTQKDVADIIEYARVKNNLQ